VRDRVRVPPLGQHRDRDDAAGPPAEAILLAYGVHHLAQEVLVGEVLGLLAVAGALDDLAAEALDLVRGGLPEAVVERLARVELLAVDQQRVRARQRVAVLVVVREEAELALERGRRDAVFPLGVVEARDVVVDQLRGRGVVADDDECRATALD
jgi:hypothetical protein